VNVRQLAVAALALVVALAEPSVSPR